MEEENNNINNEREHYSNDKGTGVMASMIFMIVVTIAMYFLSKWMGN